MTISEYAKEHGYEPVRYGDIVVGDNFLFADVIQHRIVHGDDVDCTFIIKKIMVQPATPDLIVYKKKTGFEPKEVSALLDGNCIGFCPVTKSDCRIDCVAREFCK